MNNDKPKADEKVTAKNGKRLSLEREVVRQVGLRVQTNLQAGDAWKTIVSGLPRPFVSRRLRRTLV